MSRVRTWITRPNDPATVPAFLAGWACMVAIIAAGSWLTMVAQQRTAAEIVEYVGLGVMLTTIPLGALIIGVYWPAIRLVRRATGSWRPTWVYAFFGAATCPAAGLAWLAVMKLWYWNAPHMQRPLADDLRMIAAHPGPGWPIFSALVIGGSLFAVMYSRVRSRSEATASANLLPQA